MSTDYERNTHFQGFAKLLYPDLKHWFKELFDANLERNTRRAEQAENMIKLTLTRHAYDFGGHVIRENMGGTARAILHYLNETPDITQWSILEIPPPPPE